MSINWKYKALLFGLSILFSIYILVPSVLGVKEKADQLRKAGMDLPWYEKLLSQKEINLGLDLRGGLFMEMDIGIDEALTHQVDFIVAEIQRNIIDESFKDAHVAQIAGHKLRIELGSNSAGDLQGELVRIHGNTVFEFKNEKPEIFLEIKGNAAEARKQAFAAVGTVAGFKGNVDFSHEGKFLAVSFENQDLRRDLIRALTAPAFAPYFSEITNQVNDVLYVNLSEAYIEHLKQTIVDQAANSVRNRIDRFGVAEANVSRQSSNRLVVELPGVKDAERVIEIIQRTGKLEFRLMDSTVALPQLEQLISTKVNELKLNEDRIYEKENLEKLNDALKADLPPDTEIVYQLQRSVETKKVIRSTPHLLQTKANVTGDMLSNASVQVNNNMPYVSMSFNKTGATAFGDLTSKNVGRNLAIVLDGVVESAPVIKSAIMGGEAQIELGYGAYSDLQREASDLVLVLKEGALPATLTIASKNIIGPSLGHDSIRAGLKALSLAALVVIAFMLVYYKVGGLIANIALIVNVLYIFAALALFQASLTLPGIAGIVLTMGMAVDANVIIFERMREERLLGHNAAFIVSSGYSNAMSAIVDGNLTTLISGLVLFEFGTGPIKGFATTLIIGIVTTMITAILFTRVIYDWMLDSLKIEKVRI